MERGRSTDSRDIFDSIVSFLNNVRQVKRLIMYADMLLIVRAREERALKGEDIIYELICDALHHRRKWDREAEPNFSKWLRFQIRSKVDNVARKDSRVLPLDNYQFDDPEPPINTAVREQLISSGDPVSDLEEEEFIAGVRSLFNGDETASRVFEKVLELNSDLEIAGDLGLEMSRVKSTKKKIRRRVDRYLCELRKSTGLSAIGIALFSLICT